MYPYYKYTSEKVVTVMCAEVSSPAGRPKCFVFQVKFGYNLFSPKFKHVTQDNCVIYFAAYLLKSIIILVAFINLFYRKCSLLFSMFIHSFAWTSLGKSFSLQNFHSPGCVFGKDFYLQQLCGFPSK